MQRVVNPLIVPREATTAGMAIKERSCQARVIFNRIEFLYIGRSANSAIHNNSSNQIVVAGAAAIDPTSLRSIRDHEDGTQYLPQVGLRLRSP